MKRKIVYSFIALIVLLGLTGCGEKIEKIEGTEFTISCTGDKEELNGIETINSTTYYFNKDQYIIAEAIKTNQKFEDKNVYNEYKKAQEEAANSAIEGVTIKVDSDDKKMTIDYVMTIKNIDASIAESDEERDSLKAINVLNKSEESGNKCKIRGISRSNIK